MRSAWRAEGVARARFPLAAMPAAAFLGLVLAPVVAVAAVAALALALGRGWQLETALALVAVAWLLTGLFVWTRAWIMGRRPTRVVALGSRELAVELSHELAGAERRYEVIGWVGERVPSPARHLRRLGDLDELAETVAAECIDLVVHDRHPSGTELRVAGATGVGVHVDDLYGRVLGRIGDEAADEAWHRLVDRADFRVRPPASKRAFDLIAGLLAAAVAAPALALAWLGLRLAGARPELAREPRVGEGGEPFSALRLRADRFAGVLERTGIDRAPQLLNVLAGRMSIVGPGALAPERVTALECRFAHYGRRRLTRPGLVGWAGLARVRPGAGDDARMLALDLFYLANRSLLADALILTQACAEALAVQPDRAAVTPLASGGHHG